VARQFFSGRQIESAECRFDVFAIETQPGAKPCARLHKGAFNADRNSLIIVIAR
jgi:Holliday junction resolvase-like predicted endonuclease